MKRIFSIGILILYILTLKAQLLPVRNYSTQQGLPQNQVMRIIQDSQGYIWFKTQGGVSKFDGYNFKNYNITNGLPTNNIRNFSEFNGSYYFLSNNSISVLENDKMTIYDNTYFKKNINDLIIHTFLSINTEKPTESRLFVASQKKIYSMSLDNKKFIEFYDLGKLPDKMKNSDLIIDYISSDLFYIQGVSKSFLVDVKKDTFFEVSKALNFEINEGISSQFISLDDKKKKYIFIYNDLAKEKVIWYFFDNQTKEFINVMEASSILFILKLNDKDELDFFSASKNEYHFINDKGDIFIIDISNGQIKKSQYTVQTPGMNLKNISDLYVFNNELWISTHQGLIEYNLKTKKTIVYTTENGLSNNNIQTMLVDQERNIWLGTNGTGVDMIVPGNITNYTDKNGLSHNGTSNTVQGNDGSMWISSDNGLTRFLPDGSHQYYTTSNGLASNDVWALTKDLKGNIWIGTNNNGISRFDGKKIINMRPSGLAKSGNYTSEIYVDKKGNIWVPSYFNLLKYSPDYKLSIYKFDAGTVIYQIIEDEEGNLIMAAADKGILIYKQNGELLAQYPQDKSIFDSNIVGIELINKKTLWCYTYGEGIIEFNRDLHTYKKILTEETKGFEIMKSYIRDKYHNLWIGTINGILRINTGGNVTQYTKDDGLVGNDIRSTGAYIDSQGILWFNSSFGVIRINPVEQFADKTAPKLYIKEFIMNEPVDLSKGNYVFDYKHNTAVFKFVGLEYRNPTRVRYQYYLENFDKTWSEYNNDRNIRYTNLDPGHYKFRVRAMDHAGNTSEITSLDFIIKHPFWTTWWFIILEISTALAIIILVTRWRMMALKERNEILEKTVAIRTKQLKEKNEQLLSSIRYAERIQKAILPHEDQLKEVFKEHFILYMPKDIISGDFYWFTETPESYYFAVVDCTGHGVPGALLSIVGNMLFNEIINQNPLLRPSEILELLHEHMRTVLCQNNGIGNNRDGMEVILCEFSKDFETLIFAGANRPLYIFNSMMNSEPRIIRPDRKGIGGRQKEDRRIFNNHLIELKDHDMIYLSTDGFVDQADHENHKFGSRRLKEILKQINSKPTEEQRKILLDNITEHKQNEIQRDDITLVGIKILKNKE